jgi:hypothetical protein
VTSTAFDNWWNTWSVRAFIAFCAFMMVLTVIACNEAPQPAPVKTRVPTLSTQAEPQVPPSPPPDTAGTAPAGSSEPKKEVSFYGSTIYEGEITSVYFYPQGPDGNEVGQTHIKFNHHEEQSEEIYICGDVRSKIEVGGKYRMLVTFEPNMDCISNWRFK